MKKDIINEIVIATFNSITTIVENKKKSLYNCLPRAKT